MKKEINSLILIVITLTIMGGLNVYACGPAYYDAHHGYDDYLDEYWIFKYYYKLYFPNDTRSDRYKRGEKAYESAVSHEKNGDLDKALKAHQEVLKEFNGFTMGWYLIRRGMEYHETINWLQDKVDLLTNRDNPENITLLKEYFEARDAKDDIALTRIAESGTLMSDSAAFVVAKHKMKDDPSLLDKYLEKYPDGRYRAEALGWKAHCMIRFDDVRPKRERYIDANKIYLKIIENPELHTMFRPAVESLIFRSFYDNPPKELLDNPVYVTGLVQSMIRSRRYWDDNSYEYKHGNIDDIIKTTKNAFGDRQINALSPDSAEKLAVAFCRLNEKDLTRKCALKALAGRRSALTLYLLGRLAAEKGNVEAAEKMLNEIASEFPAFRGLKELGLRIGSLHEKNQNIKAALRIYIRIGSMEDCRIITDGDISLKEMRSFMEENPEIKIEPALAKRAWRIADSYLLSDETKRDDIRTFLNKRLGIMYAREGDLKAAIPCFAGYKERAEAAEKILQCEEKLKAANENTRDSALYALGAAWYHDGHKVLFNGTSWLDYHFGWCNRWNKEIQWEKLKKEPWKSREEIAVSMNRHYRALPYFLEVIGKYPDSPEAPKALYSAALCYYWSCGKSGYRSYFSPRAERDKFWEKGDTLMKRIHAEYSEHPLAKSEWVLKVLKKEKEIEEKIKKLEEMLADPKEYENRKRMYLCQELGNYRSSRAIPVLIKALEDPYMETSDMVIVTGENRKPFKRHSGVWVEADKALRKITGVAPLPDQSIKEINREIILEFWLEWSKRNAKISN